MSKETFVPGKSNTQETSTYIAIDLKSFYASVECVQRARNPLTTNLVVADSSRTEKTICLAVSPSLKSFGIPGRPRLFEVISKADEINKDRLNVLKQTTGTDTFSCSSDDIRELETHPEMKLDYIVAPPRMALYLETSSRIVSIYLRYVSAKDLHVYSVDEVFIDVTHYLKHYNRTARELAEEMIHTVLAETGITATAGIGTNLYLCKVAMDIVAKHMPADKHGVRIAELNERTYRELLWDHRPLTDFWRTGHGTEKKLAAHGMFTMGDIARCSIGSENDFHNEDLLFRLFGVNAELLIDHAWGRETATIEDIQSYRPENNSLSSGQVLSCPYDHEKTRVVVREMADLLVFDLVERRLVTDQIVLTIGYDKQNLEDEAILSRYEGDVHTDHYGRLVPGHGHGSINLPRYTSSARLIEEYTMQLFDQISNPLLQSRRINIVANHVIPVSVAKEIRSEEKYEQLDIFTDYAAKEGKEKEEERSEERENNLQLALLDMKKKFGKNAVLKGTDLKEGATTIARNSQIGGHKA